MYKDCTLKILGNRFHWGFYGGNYKTLSILQDSSIPGAAEHSLYLFIRKHHPQIPQSAVIESCLPTFMR